MKRICIVYFLLIITSFISSIEECAAIVNGNFVLSITTGHYFYVDHNKCSLGDGPRAGFLGVKINNASGISQNNIIIELVKYTDSVRYTLAGGQASSQPLSVLANNASDTFFWYSTYPCFFNGVGFPTDVVFQVKDLDDGTSYLDTLGWINTEEQISSNGGGLVGTAQVTRRDPVGGIFSFKCDYNYPKLVAGDVAYMQPTVNLSFDAGSYQLESAVILNSTANSASCIPVGNSPLNYIISGTCNAFNITVEYYFRIKNVNGTTAYPYNSATSGAVGTKYVITSVPVYFYPGITLPVELTSYTAKFENKGVVNSWTTASEYNNEYFIIEKSKDAQSFEKVGKIDGAGNSNVERTYSFIDMNPYSGISYYRLSQIDFDGRIIYSNILSINYLKEKRPIVRLYPNPSDGVITLAFDDFKDDDIDVRIYDISGKIIMSRYIRIMENNNTAQINLNGILQGEYFISYTSNSNTGTRRFFIQ